MADKIIYFDNAATTIPNKDVLSLYNDIELNHFGNSSSIHKLGIESQNLLNKAKESIVNSFKLKDYKVYFTSSSTEANNLAIKGYCKLYSGRGKHIITTKIEHASVLECFSQLEKEGFRVTYLDVNSEGIISVDKLEQAMDNDTILVSIMAVNNEIGSINPIRRISEVVHKYPKAVLHMDTTQAIGKVNVDYSLINMFVVSGHKIHGLKGSGALIAKSKINFEPVIAGGGQEDGFRSGTVSVAHACALAKAVKLSFPVKDVSKLNEFLVNQLKDIKGIELNSNPNCSSYIVNFSLLEKKASVVVEALSNQQIYVSSVSACHSKGEKHSYVVEALGKNDLLTHNTIRVSFDKDNIIDEIKIFVYALKKILESIK